MFTLPMRKHVCAYQFVYVYVTPKPFQFNEFVLILYSYGVKHKTCKDHLLIGTKVHDVCLMQQNINARSIAVCLYQIIFTV